jgi:Protein of unknown function (DUF2585)
MTGTSTKTSPALPLWVCATAGAALVGLAGAAEFAMDRKLWGVSGEPGIWSGDIWSSHNSQYMTDPYTFSHITHGVLWYGLLALVANKLPVRVRFILAVALECAWENFENTDMVIQRYRAATISLNYYGDSVMNSMCDILTAVLGFILAAMLPTRVTLIGVIVLEVALALWIRDSLLLNVLMLIRPIQAIRTWQLAK